MHIHKVPRLKGWDTTIQLVRNLLHIDSIEEKAAHWNWDVKPHIHPDFFELFFIERGVVELTINNEKARIEGPAFLMIPKNVMHSFILDKDNLSGWVFIISDQAAENILKHDAQLMFVINEVQIIKIDISNPPIADAYTCCHKIIYEYHQNLRGRELMLQHLVGMLLLRLSRIPEAEKTSQSFYENAEMVYFRRFEQLFKRDKTPHKTIESYCTELAVSPKHLTKICQNISGDSPKEVVMGYFISQAKQALCNFEKSIAEIAYELNFEDTHYFSRLFKKKTGFSPREYRSQAIK